MARLRERAANNKSLRQSKHRRATDIPPSPALGSWCAPSSQTLVQRARTPLRSLALASTAILALSGPASAQGTLISYFIKDGVRSSEGQVDLSLPSIVVVHGWQPNCDVGCDAQYATASASSAGFRMPEVRAAIETRLKESLPPGSSGANVFLYSWRDAFQPSGSLTGLVNGELRTVIDSARDAGIDLANKLAAVIAPGAGSFYSKPLHVIGHSAGAIVGASAVNQLAVVADRANVTQLTILDAPFDLPSKVTSAIVAGVIPFVERRDIPALSPGDIQRLLPPGSVQVVDNYFAPALYNAGSVVVPVVLPQLGFGGPLQGAGPGTSGGLDVGFTLPLSTLNGHSLVQSRFYANQIQGPDSYGLGSVLNKF